MTPLESVEQATPGWLSAMLGRSVTAVRSERVGSGQIGSCHRLHLTGDDVPPTVLAKLPTEDPGTRAMLTGAYRTEVRFYGELADTVAVRVPRCFAATEVDDEGRFALLLEDLAPAEQGDQIAGCTPAQAVDAATNLAGLHGPRWCDPRLLELDWTSASGPEDAQLLAEVYGPATETFLGQVGERLTAATRTTLAECVAVAEAWTLARAERFGPVHGDYRLDNLLFPPDGGAVVAIDWQTLSIGLPARDLAYLLGTGLDPTRRREHERSVVVAYHAALCEHGVRDYPLAMCWDDYRFAMLQGPLVAVFGCAYGARSERGDAMFAVMAERSCAAIRELETLTLLG